MSALRGKKPKGKKKHVTPAHSAARAYQDVMNADSVKHDNVVNSPPASVHNAGNPYDSPFVRNLMNPPQSRNALAAGHPDLRRQSNTNFSEMFANLRTARGNVVDLGVSENTPGAYSHAGEIALRQLDAAGQAGVYHGMNNFSDSPLRPADHQHRGSAVPANGSHSLGDVTSHAVSKSALDIMRDTQRVIS